jgi:hypothetical protein
MFQVRTAALSGGGPDEIQSAYFAGLSDGMIETNIRPLAPSRNDTSPVSVAKSV